MLNRRRLNVENKRQRWNAPIQGTGVDCFKAAAAALLEGRGESGFDFKIIALIHDEIVLLVPEDHADEIVGWASGIMAEAAGEIINANLPPKLRVAAKVDAGVGSTLQEAKDAA